MARHASSLRDLVDCDETLELVLDYLGWVGMHPEDPLEDAWQQGPTAFAFADALALGRMMPGACVVSRGKVGPAGAELLAADVCLGGLAVRRGSSWRHVFAALKANKGLRRLHLLHSPGSRLSAADIAHLTSALAVNRTLSELRLRFTMQGPATGWSVSANPFVHSSHGHGATWSKLAAVLRANDGLRIVELDGNAVEGKVRESVAVALLANRAVQELRMGYSGLGDTAVRRIAQALWHNSTLRKLDLARNRIRSRAGVMIARSIDGALRNGQSRSALRELNLAENFLGPAGGIAMAAALATDTTLVKLSLNTNKLGRSVVAIARSLSANVSLRVLDVGNNNLGPASGRAIAKALEASNSGLQELVLRDNRLGDLGGDIARALMTNTALRRLDLFNCNLCTLEIGLAFAKALCTNRTLRELDLGKSLLGAIAGVAIFMGLRANAALRVLRFTASGLGGRGRAELKTLLRSNRTLRVLDLSGNPVPHTRKKWSGTWAQALEGLKDNQGLRVLKLRACGLMARDGEALGKALQEDHCLQRRSQLQHHTRSSLQELDISGNPLLGLAGCKAIAGCFRVGTALRTLNLHCTGTSDTCTMRADVKVMFAGAHNCAITF